ncbi:MAG TPA: hypothetical protein VGG24_21830 [Paraburkholderia sp.]|jgi:hypothetical protein
MSNQHQSGPRTRLVRTVARALFIAACAAPLGAHAQHGDPVKELAAPAPLSLPLKPNPAYARFPAYTGTLGNRPIVLRLGQKGGEDAEGVHGEFQYSDTGEVILVAGDREGSTLEIEESNDGKNIIGNWVGRFDADGSLSGDRMNTDDSNPQQFNLKPVVAGPGAAAGASPPAAPAAPTQNARPVGGVGNLTTGD